MVDRSDVIENTFTELTDWGTMRELVAFGVQLEGFSDPNNVIFSEFTPDHAIYPDLLADLIFKATECHPEIHSLLRSQNSVHDVMVAANRVRDRFNGSGQFNSSTGWALEGTWAISGGVASAAVPNGSFHDIASQTTMDNSSRYLFEFDITAYTSGGINPHIKGAETINGPRFTSTGHHRAIVPAPASGTVIVGLGVAAAGGFTGSVDNFVVRKLD